MRDLAVHFMIRRFDNIDLEVFLFSWMAIDNLDSSSFSISLSLLRVKTFVLLISKIFKL